MGLKIPVPQFVGMVDADTESVGTMVRSWNSHTDVNLSAQFPFYTLPFGAPTVAGSPTMIIAFVIGTANTYKTVNGTDWVAHGTMPSAGTWIAKYGNGVWVAIKAGTTSTAYSVDDGATWVVGGTAPGLLSSGTLYYSGLMFINGLFVCTYTITGYAYGTTTTADGVTWATRASRTTEAFLFVKFKEGMVALNAQQFDQDVSYDNGDTWSAFTAPMSGNSSGVWYKDHLILTGPSFSVYKTKDLVSWEACSKNGSNSNQSIAEWNGFLIAPNYGSSAIDWTSDVPGKWASSISYSSLFGHARFTDTFGIFVNGTTISLIGPFQDRVVTE